MKAPSTWVLLNGLTRLATQWRNFPGELAARLSGARVTAVDLPGVGTAADRPAPLSVAAIAEDVRERVGAAGPIGLIGSSLGGMVAMAWAAHHPGDLAACAVLNTSAGGCGGPMLRLRPAGWRMLLSARSACTTLEREERALALICAREDVRGPAAVEFARALDEGGTPTRRVAYRQMLAARAFRAPARLDVPLLVLSGACDRLVSPRCSALLATRLHADHRHHPTAGHEVAIDEPEWSADRIAEWAAR